MAKTAADVLIDTIIDWDVDVIFGLPGDGINGIMEALRTRQDKIRFIHVRTRRGGGFYGLRLCKVHRKTWCLSGDIGTRRHSSLKRTLRRKTGWSAGAGVNRPSISRSH